MKKKVVTAYCRVSTDSDDQMNSLENQKSYFNREIEKAGYNLHPIYYDEGLTGTKLDNREGFHHMLYDAGIDIKTVNTNPADGRKKFIHTVYEVSERTPKFQEIWIKNTSRFARNTLSSEIIDRLREKQVNIHFMEQNLDTNDESKDFMLKLFQTFDENDSKDKSIKVRSGDRESVKRGMIWTNSKLYGYRYIQADNRLEIIPEEAKVIQLIFKLYADGMGIRQIINALSDSGIKTRKGAYFCKSTIRRILDNEKYEGYNNALKHDTGVVFHKNSYPKVREQYDIVQSAKIPAIVTPDLFMKCREILKSKINYNNQKGIYKGNSKYRGLIYCAQCCSVYHSNTDHGHIFYNCANKKLHGTKACNAPNVSEKQIDDYIQELANGEINEMIDGQIHYAINILFNVIRYLFNRIDADKTQKAYQIKEEICDKQKVLDRYEDLYAQGMGDPNRMKIKIKNVCNEIKELQAQYEEESKSNDELINEIGRFYNLAIEAYNMRSRKAKYTVDETMQMIDKLLIRGDEEHCRPIIITLLEKQTEVESIRQQYKKAIDFKILTPDEIDEISSQLNTILGFNEFEDCKVITL